MNEKIRILFIGELYSSHFENWLKIFTDFTHLFDIRGINLAPEGQHNCSFPVQAIINAPLLPDAEQVELSEQINQSDWSGYIPANLVLTETGIRNTLFIAKSFQPHIIHTLGLFPGSLFWLHCLRCMPKNEELFAHWLIQARGGPDIALNKDDPHHAQMIREMVTQCDCLIADNDLNYQYAQELGLSSNKIPNIGRIPGTGGFDPEPFQDVALPSQKESLIIWPKGYCCIQSDALPVIEALRRVLPNFPQTKLIATAVTPEVRFWITRMLHPYMDRVEIYERIPNADIQKIYRRARILLAPSLSDGVPNSMYEAMMTKMVPILSPLDTLIPLFQDKVNTLYSDNLDPSSIEKSLILSLSDDRLCDNIAINNEKYFYKLACRKNIASKVVNLYEQIYKKQASDKILSMNRSILSLQRQIEKLNIENKDMKELIEELNIENKDMKKLILNYQAKIKELSALKKQCLLIIKSKLKKILSIN